MRTLLAHKSNYSESGGRKIDYIVIHFTSNNGDTAKGNCNYFAGANRKASAHYFVDENEVWQSVPDKHVAWHCGAKTYKHPSCRNANSIGIEMCSRKDANGQYYIAPETGARAIELTKQKMGEYGVTVDRVLRHYDVTGKLCPEPFMRNPELWDDFLGKL